MAGETIITVVGNLTADPELRYTQNGLPRSRTSPSRRRPRTFDRQANEWKDGEALFLRASVWREFAEHVAGSLTKGSRVIATGRLKQRSYETKEGEKRTAIELEVDEIGPSLRYATAQVTARRSRGGGGGGQSRAQVADEPWATPGSSTGGGADAWSTPGTSRRRHPVLTDDPGCRLRARRRAAGYSDIDQRRKKPWLESQAATAASRGKGGKNAAPAKSIRVGVIDYKDVATLRKFISERGKIRARRITGVSVQEQRLIARAVKNAREMALLPYAGSGR